MVLRLTLFIALALTGCPLEPGGECGRNAACVNNDGGLLVDASVESPDGSPCGACTPGQLCCSEPSHMFSDGGMPLSYYVCAPPTTAGKCPMYP
jgi:hypothetical protein